MNLNAGLWQQQTLKLNMTQELTQAIALLQYTAQELTAFLENKALENPLLQIEPGNVQPMDPLKDRSRQKQKRSVKGSDDWIENIADNSITLEEQLISQLNLKKHSNEQLKIIRYLIHNLDVNGYFAGSIDEAAAALQAEREMVERSLSILQGLEPAGIAADCLQKCLLLQLERNCPEHKLAHQIVSDFFVQLAEKKWKVIAKELDITLKEVQDVFDHIQSLNPRPGGEFLNEKTSFVIPDAVIEVAEGEIIVRTHDDPLPKISFNESYYKQFSDTKDQQVRRFLQEKFQDYQWILKSIEQRRETLIRVVMKIAEKQPLFFQKGPQYLKPMTMKEIAEELSIHESTVSRAVREKYVQTPSGTFELKSFFTSTIHTLDEESISSSAVKKAISLLIEKEDKQKPLSDQDIAEHLKNAEGTVVSRRTVAKYRDQLGIPSSSKRKRY
jgi:RNA polymerase sigma-54 factor